MARASTASGLRLFDQQKGFGAWTLSWASISSHVKREVPVATGEIDPAFAGAARGLGSSFLRGWRSMPGSIPATSQLDWLISTTAMIVLSWSRATRDLLKACPGEGRGRLAGASGHSIGSRSDDGAISLYLWRALGWIVVS